MRELVFQALVNRVPNVGKVMNRCLIIIEKEWNG